MTPPTPHSEPRRVLAQLALTCALTWTLDRALSIPLQRLVLSSEIRLSRLYTGRATADVIILGSSRAVEIGDNAPDAPLSGAGINAFNLSYNGMSMGVAELLLRDYLDRHPAPRRLLLEVSNLSRPNALLKALTPYLSESARLQEALRAYAPTVERATRASHLFRYNQDLAHRALYYLRRDDQSNAQAGRVRPWTITRLQEESAALRAGHTSTARGPLTPLANPLPASGPGYEALLRALRLCAARGVKVSLVVSPYLPAYAERLGALPAWTAALREAVGRAGEAEGWGGSVRFFDYGSLVMPDDHFADPVHMNTTGIRALDARMIKESVYAW